LTEIHIRKLVFETFSLQWQVKYYKSQHEFATDTIQGISGYMNLCKGSANTDEDCHSKKKGKTEDISRIRGGGNMNKYDKNQKKGN
jgi:hypothetical protein